MEKNYEQSAPAIRNRKAMHPMVARMRYYLEKGYLNHYGMLYIPKQVDDAAGIRVSPKCLNRALKIMNTLITKLEDDYKCQIGIRWVGSSHCLNVYAQGQDVDILLHEKSKRSIHVITKKEEERKKEYIKQGWKTAFSIPKYDYTPSGRLVFKIGNYDITPKCIDSPENPLEEQLNDFIELIFEEVKRRSEYARRFSEYERRKTEEQQRKKEELALIDELEQQAEAFDKANKIRTFLHYLEASTTKKDTAWIEWAYQHADSIDPLKH